MPSDRTVLRPGDLVRTHGVLVRDEEGDWFQPRLVVPAVMHVPPVVSPHWSGGAVRALGADFDTLIHPETAGPRIAGGARVTGRWTGDAVEVVTQSTKTWPPDPSPDLVTPPCPPPPGGWPHGAGVVRLDYGGLRRSGVIVTESRFHPSATQEVLAVAATDVVAAEAQLRPQLGDRLCVVQSRFSRAEFDAARAELDARWLDWGVYQSGAGDHLEGQLSLVVSLSRLLPEVLDWVATTPPGLVELCPWLSPASAVDRGVAAGLSGSGPAGS